MLVKRMGYGVWSSRTGLTVNVFVSLAGASRVCSAGEAPDRVICVMSSSRTVCRGRWSRASQAGRRSAASETDRRRRRRRRTACVSSPRLVGDDDTSHVLVIQLDEGTLHERHDRRVIAVVRDRHLEVRPRGLTVGFGCRSMLWPILVDLFRSHSLKSARDTPLHPLEGAIDTSDGTYCPTSMMLRPAGYLTAG